MTPYIRVGAPLIQREITSYLDEIADEIEKHSPGSVLFVPPDITRLSSGAGFITSYLHDRLPAKIKKAILPATGLHRGMSEEEKRIMFGERSSEMEFLTHSSRVGNHLLGRVTQADSEEIFGGMQKSWEYLWKDIEIYIDKRVMEFDLVLSLGQVLPHEITGMSNYHKNILIGLGGEDLISKSHLMGAVIGIPQIIGKADNPIRKFLMMIYDRFLRDRVEIVFLFTVVGENQRGGKDHPLFGLFCGKEDDLFYQACRLSKKKNITYLPPCDRVWVTMPPEKYHSLWLANKAIYRTQRIIKTGGEIIIDAPGVRSWGEDPIMDELISTFGYKSAEQIMTRLQEEFSGQKPKQLLSHLSVAAHLIHGYTEFRIRFVDRSSQGGLDAKAYERVGFQSISEEEFETEVEEVFSKPATALSYMKSQPRSYGGRQEYFINDAGLGFWERKE